MLRRRASGAKVSKPAMLFSTFDAPDLSPRRAPVPVPMPTPPSSGPGTPDPACPVFAVPADECEELLDEDDYEQRRAAAYLGALGALQGSSSGRRARTRSSASSEPAPPDSLARRLSTASTASKLSKRTLRLSRSVPALAPPVISHPMPLARRIRKVPSLQQEQRKGRLSALPRMFAWRP